MNIDNGYANRLWMEHGTQLTTLFDDVDESKCMTNLVCGWAQDFIVNNDLTLSFESVEQLFFLIIAVLSKLRSQEGLHLDRKKVAIEDSKSACSKDDFSLVRMVDHVTNTVAVTITEAEERVNSHKKEIKR